jgi:hypothetical protein
MERREYSALAASGRCDGLGFGLAAGSGTVDACAGVAGVEQKSTSPAQVKIACLTLIVPTAPASD